MLGEPWDGDGDLKDGMSWKGWKMLISPFCLGPVDLFMDADTWGGGGAGKGKKTL